MGHREIIANFETGNLPEGWESEGQLRISNLKKQEKLFPTNILCQWFYYSTQLKVLSTAFFHSL
jgi:hypothetical protein